MQRNPSRIKEQEKKRHESVEEFIKQRSRPNLAMMQP